MGCPLVFILLTIRKNGKALYTHAAKTIEANTGRPGEPLKKFSERQQHTLVLPGASHVVTNKKDVYDVFRGKSGYDDFYQIVKTKIQKTR